MSQLYVNNIKSRVGGAVSFSQGIISAGATFSGNVSVGGTLTYEDVTNVSVTGIITANNGISVPSGGIVVGTALTINQTGIDAVGVITAASFSGNGANLSNLNIPSSFNELDATLFS
jgi:hypothetical protein